MLLLFWLVQSIFSININGRAHAEKCLAGWAQPVTETEDEAVLWGPVSCERQSISSDTDSTSMVWDCGQRKRWRRWTSDAVASNLEWMRGLWCREQMGCKDAARVFRSFCILPFDPKKPTWPLSPPLSTSRLTKLRWAVKGMDTNSVFVSLLCCFVDDWYGFAWHLIHKNPFSSLCISNHKRMHRCNLGNGLFIKASSCGVDASLYISRCLLLKSRSFIPTLFHSTTGLPEVCL